MRKKGATSHLEMVISFVLFIMFVLFLLIYIRPYQQDNLDESVISSLSNTFEKNTSVNLTTIFLKDQTPTQGIPQVGNIFYVEFDWLVADGKSLAKTASGEEILSSFSPLPIPRIDINREDFPSEDSFYIHISPEFQDDSVSASEQLVEGGYEIGNVEKISVLSDKFLRSLETFYNENYEDLKQNFRVPAIVDFAIYSADKEYSMERQVPEKVDVRGKVYVYKVLYSDGIIKNKEFVFNVW